MIDIHFPLYSLIPGLLRWGGVDSLGMRLVFCYIVTKTTEIDTWMELGGNALYMHWEKN